MKQITTLFAVLRRCLYSIDQKKLLEFLLIYAYIDTVLSSKSNNWLLSNVISRIPCSERYICKYTSYFRLLQSQLIKLKAFFLCFTHCSWPWVVFFCQRDNTHLPAGADNSVTDSLLHLSWICWPLLFNQ